MAIAVRRERGQRTVVVVVSGAFDARAVPSLRRALVKAVRTGDPILIDLTQATSIDREGLTALVAAYRRAERTGAQPLLRTEPTQLRDVLAVFGIPPQDPHPSSEQRPGAGQPADVKRRLRAVGGVPSASAGRRPGRSSEGGRRPAQVGSRRRNRAAARPQMAAA